MDDIVRGHDDIRCDLYKTQKSCFESVADILKKTLSDAILVFDFLDLNSRRLTHSVQAPQ